MHFVVQRDQLVESVQDVMKAVSSKTTIPILTGIKITANEDGILMTGSNSDISIERNIPTEEDGIEFVELKRPGSIVLQARFFSEIVKKLPQQIVEIEIQDHFNTTIRSGSAEFHLNGLDPEEYPLLPQIQEDNIFRISANLLKEMIRQTGFAVSTSETRPILTGVNFKIEDGELHCIATDSHRLAFRKAPIEPNAISEKQSSNVVLPGKSLSELSKILPDGDDLIEMVITENQTLFKMKHILFFTRLLDGNYPDTSRLIPNESQTEVIVQSKEFLQAIDRASLLAREGRNNVVKFASAAESNQIEISSDSPEIGKVKEEVVCEQIIGENLKISFSAKYMLDALKAIDSQEVRVSFTGAMRPFVIRPIENPESILQLILPVRTF